MPTEFQIEVKSVRRYKCGYEVRTELWTHPSSDTPTPMRASYNPSGDYIGDAKTGKRLVADRGIQPILRTPNSNVCSIGYSLKDGKWYGWSHRAIFGFEIGSGCKRGQVHYRPTGKTDFLKDMIRFWTDNTHLNVRGSFRDGGVKVSWEVADTVANESARGKTVSDFSAYPDEWGRGEWTAETTADAKQMAMDFADGIS